MKKRESGKPQATKTNLNRSGKKLNSGPKQRLYMSVVIRADCKKHNLEIDPGPLAEGRRLEKT